MVFWCYFVVRGEVSTIMKVKLSWRFANRIWRFLGPKFWASPPPHLGLWGADNWPTGRDPSVLRASHLISWFLSIARWVLGVMMDNWAGFVYSPPPQEMTADLDSGAAGYVDLMVHVWGQSSLYLYLYLYMNLYIGLKIVVKGIRNSIDKKFMRRKIALTCLKIA